MGDKSTIEWTEATWNPLRGCSRVSEGCRHCYAEGVAARFSGPGQPYAGLAKMTKTGPRWTGEIRLLPEKLDEPLRWKKPRMVFVNSMSDLFHERVPDEFIDQVFAVMAVAQHHQFQVLTKRGHRMRDWFQKTRSGAQREQAVFESRRWNLPWVLGRAVVEQPTWPGWPLPNVWLGVSVEDQETADERIPPLLQTPAAVRWISAEPLLDLVDLRGKDAQGSALDPYDGDAKLDWVVVGGESGPGARPLDVAWARSLVEQCRAASVPVFVKQLGAHPCFRLEDEQARGNMMPSFHHSHGELYCKKLVDRKGGNMAEWPEDLRVREWPRR